MSNFYGAIGAGVLGGLINLYGAGQAANMTEGTMARVKAELQPWKDRITDLSDLSMQYLNRDSQLNQDTRTSIMNNVADFVGQGNLLNQRNLSSGGTGGVSGIANQNLQNSILAGLNQGETAFQQSYMNNLKFGGGLLNETLKNERLYGENLAQGIITNDAMRAGMVNTGWSSFGGGLIGGSQAYLGNESV